MNSFIYTVIFYINGSDGKSFKYLSTARANILTNYNFTKLHSCRSGLLNVARGGLPLFTCDFIADTAVDALGYVVEIFGKEDVERYMVDYMGLKVSVDDKRSL